MVKRASKITRTVLVIDEAQDMDKDEYSLIRELIKNERYACCSNK